MIESPSRPNTPLRFEERRPMEVNPPIALVDSVAAPRFPPAFPDAEPAVFMTVPAVAPAVDATPPIKPPPVRAAPDAEPIPAPDATMSADAAAASAEDRAAASAGIEAFRRISGPLFVSA